MRRPEANFRVRARPGPIGSQTTPLSSAERAFMAYQQHGIEKKDRAIAAREEEKGLCGLVYRSVALSTCSVWRSFPNREAKCVVWSAYRPSITTLLRGI